MADVVLASPGDVIATTPSTLPNHHFEYTSSIPWVQLNENGDWRATVPKTTEEQDIDVELSGNSTLTRKVGNVSGTIISATETDLSDLIAPMNLGSDTSKGALLLEFYCLRSTTPAESMVGVMIELSNDDHSETYLVDIFWSLSTNNIHVTETQHIHDDPYPQTLTNVGSAVEAVHFGLYAVPYSPVEESYEIVVYVNGEAFPVSFPPSSLIPASITRFIVANYADVYGLAAHVSASEHEQLQMLKRWTSSTFARRSDLSDSHSASLLIRVSDAGSNDKQKSTDEDDTDNEDDDTSSSKNTLAWYYILLIVIGAIVTLVGIVFSVRALIAYFR